MFVMEEFWGIEVKNGECLKVSPGDGRILHLSQASLGELNDNNGKENVNLFVNVDGKKLVLGTLITNKLPQYQFDVSFDRDFEVSHNWKSGSVYLYGYKASKSSKEELFKGESDFAGQTELKVEKVSDAGRDLVKIKKTNKDLNTQEEDETTFEDVMSDDDGKDDSQVATSKKRFLEYVECANAIPIPITEDKVPENMGRKARKARKRAKNFIDICYEDVKAKLHPCKMCDQLFVSEEFAEAHAKLMHS